MRTALALALAVLATFPSPARADWEQTRWGDSVESILASQGPETERVRAEPGKQVFGQDILARREGTHAGVPVEWQYFFDRRGGLSVVKLRPLDYANCDTLLEAVKQDLGKPRSSKQEVLLEDMAIVSDQWADRQDNLAIQLTDFARGSKIFDRLCHVTWQPYGDGHPGLRD